RRRRIRFSAAASGTREAAIPAAICWISTTSRSTEPAVCSSAMPTAATARVSRIRGRMPRRVLRARRTRWRPSRARLAASGSSRRSTALRNSEFGIWNLEFATRFEPSHVPNSKFQIPNPEFQIPNSKFLIQLLLVILFAVSLVADDGQRAAASSTAADACALLTSAEVEAVLGGSVKERKPGGTQAAGALLTSQCVFGTSSARSVSLMVARANAAGGSTLTPREYWRQQFHSTGPEKAEK